MSSSSMPMYEQPPPAITVSHGESEHDSIGPLIGVLVVIIVLGVIAVMIGRLCSGRRIIMGHGQYDIERWAERKCSSCIDGRINISITPRVTDHDQSNTTSSSSLPATTTTTTPPIPIQTPQETKQPQPAAAEQEQSSHSHSEEHTT